ncbi:MAG TPA: hypothetical protein VF696_02050 [Candidatus Paceibacterota bacterium]|jgi:hypothetical protein
MSFRGALLAIVTVAVLFAGLSPVAARQFWSNVLYATLGPIEPVLGQVIALLVIALLVWFFWPGRRR